MIKSDVIRLLSVIVIVLFGLAWQGCSSSNSKAEDGDEVQSMSDEEQGLVMSNAVIVCNTKYRKDNLYYYNIAFKVNGEYVRFDNDADYQELCPSIFFLQKAVNYADFWNSRFGYSSYSDWIESADHKALFLSIPEKVDIYLSGRQDEIQDERIRKMLDIQWYDFHPDRMSFFLSEERYGHKLYYEIENENRGVIFRDNEYNYFKDLDGNDLPSDALVAYAG